MLHRCATTSDYVAACFEDAGDGEYGRLHGTVLQTPGSFSAVKHLALVIVNALGEG